MDKFEELAKDMGRQVSKLITQTDRYREYLDAKAAIEADKQLHNKVKTFLAKHTQFLFAMQNGTATFSQERYMSQEFHKLMLNKNVNIYIESGLYFVEILAEFYTLSVKDLDIDLGF